MSPVNFQTFPKMMSQIRVTSYKKMPIATTVIKWAQQKVKNNRSAYKYILITKVYFPAMLLEPKFAPATLENFKES